MSAQGVLTLQMHHGDAWHDAARLEILQPERGLQGDTRLDYEIDYFAAFGAVALSDGTEVRDSRALSVALPVRIMGETTRGWPAFLLDLLPQGHARKRLAGEIGMDLDNPRLWEALLMRAGGAPIGNTRIKEAHEAEVRRLMGQTFRGLTRQDMLDLSDHFIDTADRSTLIASGSSGVQGEWPKVLLTRSRRDGLWYPDPVVPDSDAAMHILVKFGRGGDEVRDLILAAEAPYLEIARRFGLRVGGALKAGNRSLLIPRFDRRVVEQDGRMRVIRLGQESIIAATGVAAFEYTISHEQYLKTIARHCSDPAGEAVEYVLRDVLNLAMGNPDNHGRNTALAKTDNGYVGLTPLFDFAPMRLDPQAIPRATRWDCLRRDDLVPDWRKVVDAVVRVTGMNGGLLVSRLLAAEPFIRDLPAAAERFGVPAEVRRRALLRCREVADSLKALRGYESAAVHVPTDGHGSDEVEP